jgi:hypothetical protein
MNTNGNKRRKWNCWKKRSKRGFEKQKCDGMLNIQPLAVRSPSHSPSSLDCEGKAYMRRCNFVNDNS